MSPHLPILSTLHVAIAVFVALIAIPASAVDGVVEINQTAALAGGVGGAAADTPGLPVTLVSPGSYRLTSNLEVTDVDVTAIVIQSHDVTLDLNGFTIRNRADCRPDCGNTPGTGLGVEANGYENVTVRDGTVIGMGSIGVRTGDQGVVEGLRALGNSGSGIVAGARSTIRNCTVDGAGGDGIRTGPGGAIYDSVVQGASEEGIQGDTATLVANSRVEGSGSYGIYVTGRRASITGSVVTNNGSAGIFIADGLVADNVLSLNQGPGVFFLSGRGGVVRGNQITENTSGVDAAGSQGVLVTENAIAWNTTLAILAGGNTAWGHNVFDNNGGSPPITSGVELGENACDGNTTCP